MEDALFLARVQFGLNIGFHILFPSLTIALAWFLLGFRLAYQRTRDPVWLGTFRLWLKIFALSFAMGVVTGVVMSFRFGTNWPRFMTTVGAIAGPLLSYEVLTAFFLEATFLGVMLFGMNRVPDGLHIAATALVALGTTLSAFWILALNSWMQTPAGHVLDAGQWIARDYPPVAPLFYGLRVMVGIAFAMLAIAAYGAWRTRRGRRLRRRARREPHELHPHVRGPLHRLHGRPHAPRGRRRGRRRGRGEARADAHRHRRATARKLMDLPLVFMGLMAMAVLAYVVLDGYDLGVGMLMPGANPQEQSFMVASIGPFWDANETWLVLGIGILLAAFPVAHGVVLGALYLPVVAMLVGLMFRGVAFELRVKAQGWQRGLWNGLFWAGSFVAAFAQGVMLGRYITGFESGVGYWLFALLVGAGLCGGYVLLGATWLILKTDGALQRKAVAWTNWGLAWVALGVALVSLATPLVSETVRLKWFDFPRTLALMLLPAATIAAAAWLWRSANRLGTAGVREWHPFAAAVAIFTLAFAGLAYSLFPYVVIDRLTIWDAAAHPSALKVLFIGAALVLPFIVGCTALSYRIFRGKAVEKLYD